MNVQSPQGTLPLRSADRTPHRKASRQDTRRRNLRTVLGLVAAQGTTTRADIARTTSLTRATVSTLIGDLMDDGLIIEVGSGKSIGGKPPTLIEVNRSGRDLIVVDLSTSPFSGVVLDLLCEPIGPRLSAPQTGDHQADLDDLLDRLIGLARNPIIGIGLASPGIIDDDGVVVEAANLGWHNHPLGDLVRSRVEPPVTVINDAHASAVATRNRLLSSRDPGDRPETDLLLLRIGKGVGAGIILGGALHLGSHRAAGEIGHAVLDPAGLPCRCGNNGCVETVASANAIHTRIVGQPPATAEWDIASLEASAGQAAVDQALNEAGTALGTAASYLVNALDIPHIAVSMEPTDAVDRVIAAAEVALRPRLLPALRVDLRIAPAIGDDLALVGAGSVVISDELGLSPS